MWAPKAKGCSIDFTHDEVGRELTRQVGEMLTLDHTFDALGRLTTQSVVGATGTSLQHRAQSRAEVELGGRVDLPGLHNLLPGWPRPATVSLRREGAPLPCERVRVCAAWGGRCWRGPGAPEPVRRPARAG